MFKVFFLSLKFSLKELKILVRISEMNRIRGYIDKYNGIQRITPDIFDILLSRVAPKRQRMHTI